jgi:methylthioribose-1-phosphate isomerase
MSTFEATRASVPFNKRSLSILVLLSALFVALRLWRLSASCLWFDEVLVMPQLCRAYFFSSKMAAPKIVPESLRMIKTVEWTKDGIRMIDQRLLPTEEKYLTLRSWEEVAEAIKKMVVRGAPAIGVSAAMGLALGASQSVGMSVADLEDDFSYMCKVMGQTRPTAVNLFWAIERMKRTLETEKQKTQDVEKLKARLIDEALRIFQEDIDANRAIGRNGAPLINDGATVLTHCNAGALATAGDYGTALGVIRGARDAGKRVAVIADETRPFLQGLRLTAWELAKDDIPVTVITDNMAGHVMKSGKVDVVVVGADRIAANGDTANKIGTYMVAVLAKKHAVPFYVAAPITTLDLSLKSGEEIPIEERDTKEVTHIREHQLGPEGVDVHNPAFDITPNELIDAIITDRGVARAPYVESLRALTELEAASSSA